MTKINPADIADQTGVEESDVRSVLEALTPNWLFAEYINEDSDDD